MITKVNVSGCDDETIVAIETTQEELDFLMRLSELVNTTSNYGCMPRLWINDAQHDWKKKP